MDGFDNTEGQVKELTIMMTEGINIMLIQLKTLIEIEMLLHPETNVIKLEEKIKAIDAQIQEFQKRGGLK